MPETYNIPFFGNNASLAAEILGAHYQEQSRRSASLKSRFTRSNRSSLDAQRQKASKDKATPNPVKMTMPMIKMMN
ncbi:hypothetical protein DL546_008390 [Coniochaeta pulveracea]|uniref:Uncharacterized protein n=1 Tax=Coniochaeta pulveracea TaxID=177199 RepID=A0A420YH77_9PEZI|nr:hypothetical protein DL546_008390 [Coniochaeta pulveracea]